MRPIDRIEYNNKIRESSNFEIIDLKHFFKTRPASHLEQDYRVNFWLLLYITEGQGSHFIDFKEYPYRAGNIIIIQKNQVQHFRINNKVQGYILIINEPLFLDRELSGSTLHDFFIKHDGSPVIAVNNTPGNANRTLIDLLHVDYDSPKGPQRELYRLSLLQTFILSLEGFSQDDRPLMKSAEFQTYLKFKTLLEENFTTDTSVAVYAERLNLSKKTLNQATRKVAGLSAKEFISERILLEIKRYISTGDLLAYEISDLVGFDEPSNMTKFFKRYTGMSPSDFKKSLK